jgi:cytochrome c oxidase subunit 2
MSYTFQFARLQGDVPFVLQRSFQDPVTPYMESIIMFNYHLLTLIIGIVIVVGWMMVSILSVHLELDSNETKAFYDSNLIEIIWTSIPAFLLVCISYPSFSLLHSLDLEHFPTVEVQIFGHQWYWYYDLQEVNIDGAQKAKFGAYFLTDEILCLDMSGIKRNLEADRRLVLPLARVVKLIISGCDVLHSWAVPSFGIKVDACPGRTNITWLFLKRHGLFFGQCSEICGVNHGFMPIVVLSIPSDSFKSLLHMKIENITHTF